MKEATARLKIQALLEDAGWRFFDSPDGKANVCLEANVKLRVSQMSEWGDDFEQTKNGYVDFLLLDEHHFPLVVVEAKRSKKHPLDGKAQARAYARSANARFVILSNGSLHYFWDMLMGDPQPILRFPTLAELQPRRRYEPHPPRLANDVIERDYLALTQMAGYRSDPDWQNERARARFVNTHELKFLRDYQLRAIHALQEAAKTGKSRFLFEMATGTGKTLLTAAIIKLFLRTGNASRVLFLVDRLELEEQAHRAFETVLKNDFTAVIYKQNREDWHKAAIVVTTIQSLLHENKYLTLFAPTDFDLLISDEAHRTIGGNSRAVFEYFLGYKLGLTATPKDYLKNLDVAQLHADDPRALERRLLLDTYQTFGCADSAPTFRYALSDGVKDGFLVNPTVIDARTDITTQLLSERGYAVAQVDEDDEPTETAFFQKDFERKFFSEATNRMLCHALLDHALRDPISGEIGKTLVFCVSQHHAAKIAQILNELATQRWPGRYASDFAEQVTSNVDDAKRMTVNFSDKSNNLNGVSVWTEGYKTSKTRVCCTVGMMTTGYDCTDILNIALLRPIFSPTEFIQIKGRGTRTHLFTHTIRAAYGDETTTAPKTVFKLFDFFGNYEYFEHDFNYDEVLRLPKIGEGGETDFPGHTDGGTVTRLDGYTHYASDALDSLTETPIGMRGMKVDRMYFDDFADDARRDPELAKRIQAERWEDALDYVQREVFNKPEKYYTLDKLRRAAQVDRRLTLREMLEFAFGLLPEFKSRAAMLDEEFQKFVAVCMSSDEHAELPHFSALKHFFESYITDAGLREILETKQFARLNTHSIIADFRQLPTEWRQRVPEYVKDYVPLNKFLS